MVTTRGDSFFTTSANNWALVRQFVIESKLMTSDVFDRPHPSDRVGVGWWYTTQPLNSITNNVTGAEN